MTQPTERRFVMEPRLDAEVETINLAIDAEETARIAGDALKVAKAGDTMTGALVLNADPTLDLHAATKQYVDNVTINTDNLGDIDYIQFDTTYAGGSTAAGMLAWDQANETLQFMVDDHVTLQVGQEHLLRVKNNSGSVAIPDRTVVMFAGATGDTIKVTPAVSDGTVNVNYLAGITTEEIPADGFGFVTQLGFVNHVNTNLWPVGTLLYSDPATPGGLTATEPESPAWTMPVAAVTKQNASAGRLLVRAIPGGSGAGGGASVNISDTAPVGGNPGDMWYDSTDGTLYVYYEDVDGSQWVQVQANSALTAGIESRVGALESQAIAFGTLSPNLLLNGAFDVWQRGTSVAQSGGGTGSDMWREYTDSGSGTQSKDTTDYPTGVVGQSYKFTAAANNTNWTIFQVMETANALALAGRTVTLSAYMKSNISRTIKMNWNSATGVDTGWAGSWGTQTSTNKTVTTSWDRYSITFTVPSNAKTLQFGFGSNGNDLASGATVNIAGVQLEIGSTATAFRRNGNGIQEELASCQRHYFRINGFNRLAHGFQSGTTQAQSFHYFPVDMRIVPTTIDYSGLTWSDGIAGSATVTSATYYAGATQMVEVRSAITSYGAANRPGTLVGTYIGFSAEL